MRCSKKYIRVQVYEMRKKADKAAAGLMQL